MQGGTQNLVKMHVKHTVTQAAHRQTKDKTNLREIITRNAIHTIFLTEFTRQRKKHSHNDQFFEREESRGKVATKLVVAQLPA